MGVEEENVYEATREYCQRFASVGWDELGRDPTDATDFHHVCEPPPGEDREEPLWGADDAAACLRERGMEWLMASGEEPLIAVVFEPKSRSRWVWLACGCYSVYPDLRAVEAAQRDAEEAEKARRGMQRAPLSRRRADSSDG